MRNPYIVDRPLTDQDLFYGREDAFDLLSDYINTGQRLILLFGKPQIGKTSFLNQLDSRHGNHYVVRRVEWATLAASSTDPLWRILMGIGQAIGGTEPDGEAYEARAASYVAEYVESLFPGTSDVIQLICFDAVPATDLMPGHGWDQALGTLYSLLDETSRLAVLLAISGRPAGIDPEANLPDLPQIVLRPLQEEETEDLLVGPVRGTMTFDIAAIRRIHWFSGGEPLLVQLFGRLLFERRARAGWAGLAEVNHAVDQVVALSAPQFEKAWNGCSPEAQVVLCTFAEMIGYHGVGTAKDVALHLARLHVRVPVQDIDNALNELADRDTVDALGGGTYRFTNQLFRHWLKENKSTIDTLQQLRHYRRARVRHILPARSKPIDWASWLLWLVAGLLAFLIIFVWQSRQREIVWTGKPTPSDASSAASSSTPTFALHTPETGVAPGHIVYVSKDQPEDTWQIYIMRSDGSDPVRLTHSEDNETLPTLAADGRHIVFVSDRDGNYEIYIMNADGNEQLNLTNNAAKDWTPTWSPDGQRIAFASFRDGNWEIYVMDADGSNQERLTGNDAADYGPSWSPDGKTIAFVSNRDGNLEIYLMDADGGNQRHFAEDDATDQSPAWSPDSSQVLWESYREDNMEIFAANVDGSGLRNLSRDAYADDHGPTWSPWGQRIAFYSNRDHGWDIYTLDIETGERVNLTLSPALEQSPHWGP